ncbi:MAG: hypothetical protein EON54_22185, partial [Alcaligenaceae bacterium]
MRAIREFDRRFVLLAVICLIPSLSGCVAVEGYPARLEYSAQYVSEVGAFTSPNAILTYNTITDPVAAMQYRNNIITARIFAIDANFHDFVRELTTQQNLSNIGVDWAAIGLASAGAVVGSTQTKAILAAIAAGVLGAKSSVDKDLFYNKTIAALVTIMEGQRKIVLAQIYTGLNKSSGSYTIFQALADLDSYYNAGTINGALVGLTTTAGLSSDAGSVRIAAALSSDFTLDENSAKLRRFLRPDGKLNSKNQSDLKDWMR